MANIVMKPIAEEDAGGRQVMDTGVSMIGLGGDNWKCGYCGREMMHEVPLQNVKADLLYRCGLCGGLNQMPDVK
jgi:DNA-directed RNA polymerase subunit RPC12/RpoP